jgi:hypothetical protein
MTTTESVEEPACKRPLTANNSQARLHEVDLFLRYNLRLLQDCSGYSVMYCPAVYLCSAR